MPAIKYEYACSSSCDHASQGIRWLLSALVACCVCCCRVMVPVICHLFINHNHDFVCPLSMACLSGAAARVMSTLTSLRQCCCHPHIVRREAERAHKGNERSSMREIMGRLVMQVWSTRDGILYGCWSARHQMHPVDAMLKLLTS